MRFSVIQGVVLAIVGLTSAQSSSCPARLIDFENLTGVSALGTSASPATPIPNGYSGLNWSNLYGATPSLVAQFLLPQGKIFAVAPSSPASNPPKILAPQGTTFDPQAIFVGTYLRSGLNGAAALPSASTITVTATFRDGTTAQTTFTFNPPNTVFGLAISAEALQYFTFPCAWANVVSLSFMPQAANGANAPLGLALDNLQLN